MVVWLHVYRSALRVGGNILITPRKRVFVCVQILEIYLLFREVRESDCY